MRHFLAALLVAALSAAPAYAQRRGGGGFQGGGFRGSNGGGGIRSFSPGMSGGTRSFTPAFAPAFSRGFAGRGPSFGRGTGAFVQRSFHRFHGVSSFQPQIAYGAYAAYPVLAYYSYPSPYYNYTEMYPAGDYAAPPVMAYGGDQQLNDQVYGLAQQVRELRDATDQLRAQLREQQVSAAASVPIPAQRQQVEEVPTVLVYRDGHHREIQNYAIVGQTLWVLTDQRALKVAISDLDLEKTVNTNQDRGVSFPLAPAAKR